MNATRISANERSTGRPEGWALTAGRLAPVAVLVAGLVAFIAFDLDQYVTLETLKSNREFLKHWVEGQGIVAGVAFAAIYTVTVALSVPGGAITTVTGGFLFGPYWATLYVVFGATVGATALFLAARHALGDFLQAREGGALRKMEAGFNEHPKSYLFILRLVPVFPFWLVNIVPAFLGVTASNYVTATFFGIIPGSFVYALMGDGAGAVLDAGEDLDRWIIFEPRFLAPIIGLAILAYIPVAFKKTHGPQSRRRVTGRSTHHAMRITGTESGGPRAAARKPVIDVRHVHHHVIDTRRTGVRGADCSRRHGCSVRCA